MSEFQRGDVVGGDGSVKAEERCYYWRDRAGKWLPFPPEDNEQHPRTDEEILAAMEKGLLIRYPQGGADGSPA